jgi:rubredoxin
MLVKTTRLRESITRRSGAPGHTTHRAWQARGMPDTRECPLCGGTMQLKQTTVPPVPGYVDTTPKKTLEWVCPDCDYFEEADGENA